jgi:S-disulfanyl-L-cysteine oxidoreductase SoxD
MILAAPTLGLTQSPAYNVGTPLSQEEIKGFDFMIGPEGRPLPAGRGTAKEGAVIFAQRCEVCHGKNGESGGAPASGVGQSRQTLSRSFQG